jgi:endonuclease/exonuclease/phosphatase (EEP) superfamily protein YafD
VVWNIHRNGDPGWEHDLAAFASASDLVLLQEATLTRELRERLDRAGRHWAQADAWSFDGVVTGVLIASAEQPRAACVLRASEPLLALPKSALVAWYRIAGRTEALAVANVHSVNFTLDTVYRAARRRRRPAGGPSRPGHPGGDFNTWSADRAAVLAEVAARAGFTEATRARHLELPRQARRLPVRSRTRRRRRLGRGVERPTTCRSARRCASRP